VPAPYAFTGREWEPESGLYYYRARYYDPKIGRFISEDPYRWLADANLYVYVRNNPVNRTDPTGLFDIGKCWRAQEMAATLASQVHRGLLPDKVAHCLAHCELTKRCGALGRLESTVLGPSKEVYDSARGAIARAAGGFGKVWIFDPHSHWEWDDMGANAAGRSCVANRPCSLQCQEAQTLFSSGN
jgi:RHS repeat-associated protein